MKGIEYAQSSKFELYLNYLSSIINVYIYFNKKSHSIYDTTQLTRNDTRIVSRY
jgi:hypothetical protein